MFKSFISWLTQAHSLPNWLLLIWFLCLIASLALVMNLREEVHEEWPEK